MKKLLLKSLFVISALTTLHGAQQNPLHVVIQNPQQPAYIPATGPLTLGFKKAPVNSLAPAYEGAIIDTILQDNDIKQQLGNALASIVGLRQNQHNIDAMLTSLQDGSLTYEQIVQMIKEKDDSARYQALCALEEGLVKLYQKYAYVCTLPTDGYTGLIGRTFFTGIRTPICWIQDTEQMTQIITELNTLAHIADTHYPAKSMKMKTRIALLSNWRKTTTITTGITALVGYLAYNKLTK